MKGGQRKTNELKPGLQLGCKSYLAEIYSIDRACFSLAFLEHFSPLFCSLDFLLHFFIKKKVEEETPGPVG